MTSVENDYKWMAEYRKEISSWLKQFNFQWFVTMRVPEKSSVNVVENTEKHLKNWRRNQSKNNKIQICHQGIIVTSHIYGVHTHLLMSGKNTYGKTLLDMDEREWEHEWSRLTKQDCHIQLVQDNGISGYLASPKNIIPNHFELLTPYNQKLLNKFKYNNSIGSQTEEQVLLD